ncbi:hypothetical protein TNCV_650731 [Trichonephila clavipes]|nr:hypothetical protein TNCV_650731 [Trichonephila clavipes]
MTLHSPTENSLAVLNHKILEANSQVQNVKLDGHQTCLSINQLWHELRDMLRRLVWNVTLWYGVPCLLLLLGHFWDGQCWLWMMLELSSNDISQVLNQRHIWQSRRPSCQVIYSQFGLAIHQNDHEARRRFVEWAQNEIAVVPDFHKRILFSDEAHFWLNGYVNKQNCRIWSEANPQVYVETPLHPEKLTVWCALWAGGILLQKR